MSVNPLTSQRILWNEEQRKLVMQFLTDLCHFLYPDEPAVQLFTQKVVHLEIHHNLDYVNVIHGLNRFAKLDIDLNLYCQGKRQHTPVVNLRDTEVPQEMVTAVQQTLLSVNSQFRDICTLILPFLDQPCYLAHFTNRNHLERYRNNVMRNGPYRPIRDPTWNKKQVAKDSQWIWNPQTQSMQFQE